MSRVIAWVPGIDLVAITGSVAAGNAREEDDIDLLVVTSAYTLWVVRPLVLLLISVFFRRRLPLESPSKSKDSFCPNLWLDQLSLTLPAPKRSLYSSHEVLQIIPLIDRRHTYNRFIRQNSWTKSFLANAYQSSLHSSSISPSTRWSGASFPRRAVKGPRYSWGESIQIIPIFSLLLIPLNYLFYLSQLLYMLPKRTSETVTIHSAFLHTNDYSKKISTHLGLVKDI